MAKLYIKRFGSASSIEFPTAPERENVREKSYWGYNDVFRGRGTPSLDPSTNETKISKQGLSMNSHRNDGVE